MIQTETKCVSIIAFSEVFLKEGNVLHFIYKEKILLNAAFMTFITKEITVTYSKPVSFSLNLLTALGSFSSEIFI